MIAVGQTLGNYRITGTLGQGGMGAVFSAEHQVIGRRAAVKVLHADLSKDQETVRRFFNEARSSSLIKHAGIVDVLDFGYSPDGAAYLVMELLEGESLLARMRRQRKLPLVELVPIVRQIAAALGAAHGAGIVHRDLKPDNVFLVRDPEVAGGVRVKILDFGIAKLAGDSAYGVSQTRTGLVMGTPLYMAPEQCKGAGQVDRRADIYALGCMMFEMVTGQVPFIAEGAGEVMAAHIHVAPTWPRMLDPSIPPALEAIILRALSKQPEQRQHSMDELAAAVERLLPSSSAPQLTQASAPMGVQVGPPSGPGQVPGYTLVTPPPYTGPGAPAFTPQPPYPTGPGPGAAATSATPRRRRGLWIALGASVVAAGALIAVLVSQSDSGGGTGASTRVPTVSARDREALAEHLEAATDAEAEGDYETALSELESAYDLSHEPDLLRRMAEVAQHLSAPRALVLYRRYLGVLPSAQQNSPAAMRARSAIQVLSASAIEFPGGGDYEPPRPKASDRPRARSF
ncbi:MAG: protein kinase [Deltaproteobacteria bacterium]|nr:protein kinase [Deltaproteobacteria bacterium]